MEMSAKQKIPWITYNGEDVADSQFCIEYLNEKFGVDLNAHLTEEEKAIARAFQKMTEENLYWLAIDLGSLIALSSYRLCRSQLDSAGHVTANHGLQVSFYASCSICQSSCILMCALSLILSLVCIYDGVYYMM